MRVSMRSVVRYIHWCRPVMLWGACLAFGSMVTVSARQTEQGQTHNPNPDLTRGEIASFDRFLDENREIDRELTANPSLINNAEYLQHHPELRAYLNDHANVKEEIRENPNYFMKRENAFDAREARRRNQRTTDQGTERQRRATNPNPDLTTAEVASFDRFLDDHKGINKKLQKNPQLVNDSSYLKKHKDLQSYLDQHAGVREELTENPSYFMKRERRYEFTAADRASDLNASARARSNQTTDVDRFRSMDRDPDGTSRNSAKTTTNMSQKDVKETSKFLEKHKKINKDLEKNPALVRDNDYVRTHKDLRAFMERNPQAGRAMREDPSRFMHNEARMDQMNHKKMKQTKQTPAEDGKKTKMEQKEATRPNGLH